MFLGHHAVALAAKKADPKVNLGTLIFSAQFLDLLWPILIILGVEQVRINPDALPFLRLDLYNYPISHSLFTSLFWACLIGTAYFLINKNKLGGFIVGCTVFSHWVLDLISHNPDLPIAPGLNQMLGFGLWNSTTATIIVESTLFIAGVFFYFHATKAKDKIGQILPWTLIIFVVISYVASIFSPPPPNAEPVAWMALSQWLFVPWGYCIDRHREVRL